MDTHLNSYTFIAKCHVTSQAMSDCMFCLYLCFSEIVVCMSLALGSERFTAVPFINAIFFNSYAMVSWFYWTFQIGHLTASIYIFSFIDYYSYDQLFHYIFYPEAPIFQTEQPLRAPMMLGPIYRQSWVAIAQNRTSKPCPSVFYQFLLSS